MDEYEQEVFHFAEAIIDSVNDSNPGPDELEGYIVMRVAACCDDSEFLSLRWREVLRRSGAHSLEEGARRFDSWCAEYCIHVERDFKRGCMVVQKLGLGDDEDLWKAGYACLWDDIVDLVWKRREEFGCI